MKNKFIRVELIRSATTGMYSYPADMPKEEVIAVVRDTYLNNHDFEVIDGILEEHGITCIDDDVIIEVIS